MKTFTFYLPIFVLVAYALFSLFQSSSLLIDLFDYRDQNGINIAWILYVNLITSILYLAAAYNWYRLESWAYKLLGIATFLLILAQIGLHLEFMNADIIEEKTIETMYFSIVMTAMFTIVSYLTIGDHLKKKEMLGE